MPTALQLTLLGIDSSDPGTERCRGLVSQRLKGPIFRDANSVPHYQAFGHRWYQRCAGRHSDYWSKSAAERSNYEPSNLGLVASEEWRLRKGEHFLVLACTRPGVRQDNESGGKRLFGKGNVFAVVSSEQSLFALFSILPPADRFFAEVILPDTAHKCFMDIECDVFPDADKENIDKRIQFLQEGLHALFIPKVCDFFRVVLGVPFCAADCYVLDASKPGVKFSAHLVFSSAACHYFASRSDSWFAMVLLAKYLQAYASSHALFENWLYFKDLRNHTQMVWDFGIYGSGARNMRMIGACKADKLLIGTHWNDCRVFRPIVDQRNADYSKFICTVPQTAVAQCECIAITQEHMIQAAEFGNAMRQEMMQDSDKLYWFQNSRNIASEARRRGVGMAEIAPPLRASSLSEQLRFRKYSNKDNLRRLAREVFALRSGELRSEASRVFPDLAELEAETVERFLREGKELLAHVGSMLHPLNEMRIEPGHNGELLTCTMSCRVANGTGRQCFFGCTRGNHFVRLDMDADLSIRYMCYGCRMHTALLPSCLRPGIVPPACRGPAHPPDFTEGFIDYDELTSEGPFSPFMREIKPLAGTNKYMPAGDGKRTVIAMGSMGSGKTFMTQAFVANVRKEEPAAVILAISFRKMLAKMFSSKLSLRMYTEAEEYSLFGEQLLACQLESLFRLTKPREREGDVADQCLQAVEERVMRKTFDVVVIDEIESVMAHFESKTLENRVNCVWKILRQIATHCRCLIVCDADIGSRTFEFLRGTRRVDGRVPNLTFHCNRLTQIKTHFYDYVGEREWYQELLRRLIKGQCVFYFSNYKKHMRAVKSMLVRDLYDIKDRYLAEDIDPEPIDAVLRSILVIDAETSNSAKMQFVQCNETWVRYRLVMISPTVGAGIDFTVKDHFDVAFGYAGQRSVSPRGWNQMRGRVRFLKLHECHLYIDEAADQKAQASVEMRLREENRAPGFEQEDILQAEQAEDMEPADLDATGDIEKPVTLHAAMHHLARNRKLYLQDDIEFREVHEHGVTRFSVNRVTIDASLRNIRALNLVEKARGEVCFRYELIKILQAGNPDVEYEFQSKYNVLANQRHALRIAEFIQSNSQKKRRTVAAEQDLSLTAAREIEKLDQRGTELHDLPVHVFNQQNLAHLNLKNRIKHFYGLADDLPEPLWEQILRVGGSESTMTAVKEFCFIVAATFDELEEYDRLKGPLKAANISMRDYPFEPQEEQVVQCKSLGSQEIWPCRKSKRRHFWILLWANGFDVSDPFQRGAQCPPLSVLPGIGCGSGHAFLAAERLKSPTLQEWFQNSYVFINQELCGGGPRKPKVPAAGKPWDHKMARAILKQAFMKTLNIDLLVRSTHSKKKPRKRNREESSDLSSEGGSSDQMDSDDPIDEACACAPSVLDVCPEREGGAFRVQKHCLEAAHKKKNVAEGQTPCDKVLHVTEESLAVMLSLSWLFVNAKSNQEGRDKLLVNKVCDAIREALRTWNRVAFLSHFMVQGGESITGHQSPANAPSAPEAIPDSAVGYASYCNDFEKEDCCENFALSEEMLSCGETSESDLDFEYSQELALALRTVRTAEESSSQSQQVMLRKKLTPAAIALREMEKEELVSRYIGPDPYKKDVGAFVKMMMTPAYESRRKRLLKQFEADPATVGKKRARLLE